VWVNAVSSGYISSKSLPGVFPGPNRWPGNTPANDFFSSNPDDPAFNNAYREPIFNFCGKSNGGLFDFPQKSA
jgi:hypothetical protein